MSSGTSESNHIHRIYLNRHFTTVSIPSPTYPRDIKHIHFCYLFYFPFPFQAVSGTKARSFVRQAPLLPFLYFSISSLYNNRTDLGSGAIFYSITAEFLLLDPPIFPPIRIILYSENTNVTAQKIQSDPLHSLSSALFPLSLLR